ncbi:conserved hypothetical protein [Ricinus communis]|uniref:Uncharacterized protein n=1 Tax=Ricinus communis TaxID=3988 RepID=B9RTT2_RICCO|nr:conserved hypothetical protein [Ricinus communis]
MQNQNYPTYFNFSGPPYPPLCIKYAANWGAVEGLLFFFLGRGARKREWKSKERKKEVRNLEERAEGSGILWLSTNK